MSESSFARLYAVKVISAVVQSGHSLDRAHVEYESLLPNGTARALGRALSYGVLRDYFRLQAIVAAIVERPLKTRDQDVLVVIMMGLFQLQQHRAPEYAVVSESVNIVVALGKSWAKALVNAVLRRFIRERTGILEDIKQNITAYYAAPQWLIESVRRDWPEQWQTILQTNNRQAPMILRVNCHQISRDEYLALLQQNTLAAEAVQHVPDAVRLINACEVDGLPGFAEGWVSVQDAAAQWAALLLDVQPGDRVLDACAAPGGKTLHILERQPALTALLALDNDAARADKIQENLQRVMPKAAPVKICVADATEPALWWDQRPYNRVLLDAPCSGTGVIRRHPDIQLLRRPQDIVTLQQQQWRLLTALWDTVAPGGYLLYCTCSILKAENEDIIQRFLNNRSDANAQSLVLPHALPTGAGMQFLPGQAETDGFYYALLRKVAGTAL